MPNKASCGLLIERRTFVRGLAASGFMCFLAPGCGYFPAEQGDAFEPWNYPDAGDAQTTVRMAKAGLLAASPHNTQPWLLSVSEREIEVWADLDRSLGAMDPEHREMFIGLGCAVENMRLAALDAGHACDVVLLPDATEPGLAARLVLLDQAADRDPLFDAIPHRHTHRGRYAECDAPSGLGQALRAELPQDGAVQLIWLARIEQRRRMRSETIAATRAIIGDDAMSRDSYRWYRHTEHEIQEHRDGVTLDATGQGAFTRRVGKMLPKPSREKTDAYWLDATKHEQTTASAFVILASRREDAARTAQLAVGRAFQRMQLWATQNGLGVQPLNQLTERRDREESAGQTQPFGAVLSELVADDQLRAQMIFRIGYPWDHAFKSPRRPLPWVEL